MSIIKYTKKLFLYFLLILIGLSTINYKVYAKTNLTLIRERSEEDVYLFNAVVRNTILDTIVAFVEYDKDWSSEIFIPLSGLFNSLEIKHSLNLANGTINGWIFSENNTFYIDLKSGVAKYGKKKIELDSSMVEMHEEDIYANSKFIEKFLPLKITTDFNSLELIVESHRKNLPLEIRIDKEERLKRFKKNPKFLRIEDLDYTITDKKFSLPLVDFNSSYVLTSETIGKAKKQRSEDYTYSFTGRNLLFGLDSKWNAIFQSDKNKPDVDFALEKYYYDDRTKPFGKIKQIEAGDIYSYSTMGLNTQEGGRGLKISTLYNADASRKNTLDINGFLNAGWEVEIYKEGNLIDFISEGTNGRYEFKDLPIIRGLNKFKLIFYGPQGQIIEEERNYLIRNQNVLENEFGFEASINQNDRYLFENKESTRGNRDQKDLSLVLNTYYGINNNFSFNSGINMLHDPSKSSSSNSKQDQDTDFLTLGFDTFQNPFSFQYLSMFSRTSENIAHSLIVDFLSDKFKSTNVNIEMQYFNKVKTEESIYFGNFADNRIKARFLTNFKLLKQYSFPFELSLERAEEQDTKNNAYELYSRISHNLLKKYNLTASYNRRKSYSNQINSDANLLLNKRFRKISFRGELNYSISPMKYLDRVSATLNYYRTPKNRLYSKWDRSISKSVDSNNNKITDTLDTYTIGASHITQNIGNFSAEFAWNTDSLKSILLGYSIGIGFDTHQNKIISNSSGFGNSGVMNARVFLDENNNGVFDEDEDVIEGVKFTDAGNYYKIKTNDKGIATFKNIPTYIPNKVKTKEGTYGDDIFLSAKKDYKYYIAKPGSIAMIDIPIIRTGDIDGEVLDTKGESVKNIQLILKNKDGDEIQKTKTDIFGYFVFTKVPLDEYIISFNSQQLEKLKYKKSKEYKATISKDEPIFTFDIITLRKQSEADIITKKVQQEAKEKIKRGFEKIIPRKRLDMKKERARKRQEGMEEIKPILKDSLDQLNNNKIKNIRPTLKKPISPDSIKPLPIPKEKIINNDLIKLQGIEPILKNNRIQNIVPTLKERHIETEHKNLFRKIFPKKK